MVAVNFVSTVFPLSKMLFSLVCRVVYLLANTQQGLFQGLMYDA